MTCLSGPRSSATGLITFGYEYLSFNTRKLEAGPEIQRRNSQPRTGHRGAGRGLFGTSSRGEWHGIGQRETVFDGLPYTVYLPIRTVLR